ncbi:MAG: hypothetical protein AAB575_04835 [Patescibacteria group bacterium]
MKKKLGLLLVLFLILFGATACNYGQDDANSLIMKQSIVKKTVDNWRVYTNPAYRYELRFPLNWKVTDSGEDGKDVIFYISGATDNKPVLAIKSYSNWQEGYDLETFYSKTKNDLFKTSPNREEIKIDGQKGIWFKDAQMEGEEGQKLNVVSLDLDDRIVEILIIGEWNDTRAVVNSLNFYPNKAMDDL